MSFKPNPLGLEDALYFFKVWTSEMAYVLGLFYADGCVTSRGGRSGYNEVNIELKDVEHLKLVAKTIDPKLRTHEYSRKDGRHSARFQYLSKESIRTVGAWMYSASPLRLERKFQKWQETLLPWNKHAVRGLA